MFKFIQKLILKYRIKKAVKKANELSQKTGRKYFVLMCNSKPIAISKRKIKSLMRKRYFKKGTKIEDIEKQALHVTK